MEPIRVACVRYLNTAPLVEGLDRAEGLTLIPAVPSDIAAMVRSGEADVGLASIVDAAAPGEPLAIAGCGMIGCAGRTLTVRLFSAVPPERITTLHADAESHTSVALARVLLAERHGVAPAVKAFDARELVALDGSSEGGEGWPEAVLLIGDKVVTHSPPAVRYPYQLDLGQAWHEMTGLPFVYAAWMCRASDLEDDANRRRLGLAFALLDRQRRHNATRLDWLLAHWAARTRWPMDLARQYVGELLRYELGEDERRAIERFLELAAAIGVIPPTRPRFADPAPPSPTPLAGAPGA